MRSFVTANAMQHKASWESVTRWANFNNRCLLPNLIIYQSVHKDQPLKRFLSNVSHISQRNPKFI
jgi:hypothetical protein